VVDFGFLNTLPSMRVRGYSPASESWRRIIVQVLKPRETDIVQVVKESIRIQQKTDSIKVSLCNDIADTAVRVDQERIQKMLSDLVTNAVEAMPLGGDLTVVVEGDLEQVYISIKDTGVGISHENMDQLFTPFFTTKPVGEGTGLGLPSAYGTVKAHSGRIAMESNTDPQNGPTGTIVRITLPRRLLFPDPVMKLILHDE
jgi:signal transduction histidine kinase